MMLTESLKQSKPETPAVHGNSPPGAPAAPFGGGTPLTGHLDAVPAQSRSRQRDRHEPITQAFYNRLFSHSFNVL